MRNYETIPEPTVADKIVDIAINLVDGYPESTQDTLDSELLTARYYVPDNESTDGKYPSLKINIPKEQFSQRYAWRAELTFGNQDPALSTHVLVRQDGTANFTDYTEGGQGDRAMDEQRLEAFLVYLEDVKDNLIPDQN